MSGTTTPYRSPIPAGHDRFSHQLRAEWTKFRTVRGWVIAMIAAVVVLVLVGLLGASGSHTSCGRGPECSPPTGPGGQAVTDHFEFVHQPLDGDGSITARVTSLTGLTPSGEPTAQPAAAKHPDLESWAKAGLIIKESTTQGSVYAAVMITGSHGVRMQYNYTHDTAGSPRGVSAASPRWLRLTRAGDALTGYESADDRNWTHVATAHLDGLPSTVQVGLFVASPDNDVTTQHLGRSSSTGAPTQAIATFDHVSLQAQRPGGTWTRDDVGSTTGGLSTPATAFKQSGGTFTIGGSGDIAPAVGGPGPNTVESSLAGTFAALIVLLVLATMFITTEYRRGLIRTTLAASPRRGRALMAKAIVVGVVTFVVALVAAAVAFWVVGSIRRSHGDVVLPATSLTELRVVAGTAALLAVAAVLAVAVGSVLRRSAGAVAAVIVLIVLPYVIAVASVLPTGPAQWLLRVTPAAAFAIQQSIPQYPQVSAAYTPSAGYYPLPPWIGFGVLCAWTALALGFAAYLLRTRDA